MFKKFTNALNALLPAICILCVACSFVLSIVALSKSISNERTITEVQSSVEDLSRKLDLRLQALDAHVGVIEKYAQANYEWFYGDSTTENKGFIVIDKSTTKSKK